MNKTRVVVVDDSALVRSLLTEIINRQSDMQCVGAAADPLVAREMIRELNPRRHHARCRDAAHGRHRVPRQADAPEADARGDGVDTHRARRRSHAEGARARRHRLRRQAQDRHRRRLAATGPGHHRQDPHRGEGEDAQARADVERDSRRRWRHGRREARALLDRPAVDREDHLHRRLDRRHRSHARSPHATAARRPRRDDHAAHALRLHQELCGAARRPLPHRREGGGRRRTRVAPAMPTSRRAACI